MAVEAKIEGNKIIISCEYDERGVSSKTGKSRVHASTHGNQSVIVNGKVLSVGLNVYSK